MVNRVTSMVCSGHTCSDYNVHYYRNKNSIFKNYPEKKTSAGRWNVNVWSASGVALVRWGLGSASAGLSCARMGPDSGPCASSRSWKGLDQTGAGVGAVKAQHLGCHTTIPPAPSLITETSPQSLRWPGTSLTQSSKWPLAMTLGVGLWAGAICLL